MICKMMSFSYSWASCPMYFSSTQSYRPKSFGTRTKQKYYSFYFKAGSIHFGDFNHTAYGAAQCSAVTFFKEPCRVPHRVAYNSLKMFTFKF